MGTAATMRDAKIMISAAAVKLFPIQGAFFHFILSVMSHINAEHTQGTFELSLNSLYHICIL